MPLDAPGLLPYHLMQRTLYSAVLVLTLCGCTARAQKREALEREVIQSYAAIVHASYEDSLIRARELRDAVRTFVDSPAEATLQSARGAWRTAREPYGQTEAFRFYGGPVDSADGPEGLINAWPLDEAYVDYVEGGLGVGIIGDPESYPIISRDLLISLNENGSEENISVGFHAIEFLLWGQDRRVDGPGDRPFNDYVEGATAHADRRGRYLTVAADLLVENLEELVSEWSPDDPENYRADFVRMSGAAAIENILIGIGVLSKSELAGERIFTAYDNQDQEDEHSCFSDNTHLDLIANVQGIANVLHGRYDRVDGSRIEGTGVEALLRMLDPESADELTGLVERALAIVRGIPPPFDRAIVDPDIRPLVLEAVYALQDQGDKIAEAGTQLGLTINTALPD